MTISRDLANVVPIITTSSTSATIKGTTGANTNLTIDTATAGNGGPYITLKEATSQKALIGTSGAILGNTTDDLAFIADTVGGGIRFFTNASATERMRLDSSGQLLVGVTATANGGVVQVSNGITFPASQNPCSDANTLDDYEEGTWTPAFTPEVGAFTSITYAPSLGYYVKIGKWVWVTAQWNIDGISVGTASGGLRITGIPFNASGGRWYTAGIGYSRDWTNAPLGVGIYNGQSYLSLFRSTGASGIGTQLVVSDLNTGAPNKNELGFTIVYQTAS